MRVHARNGSMDCVPWSRVTPRPWTLAIHRRCRHASCLLPPMPWSLRVRPCSLPSSGKSWEVCYLAIYLFYLILFSSPATLHWRAPLRTSTVLPSRLQIPIYYCSKPSPRPAHSACINVSACCSATRRSISLRLRWRRRLPVWATCCNSDIFVVLLKQNIIKSKQ